MKNTFNTIMSILILVVLAAGVYFIVQTVCDPPQLPRSPSSR